MLSPSPLKIKNNNVQWCSEIYNTTPFPLIIKNYNTPQAQKYTGTTLPLPLLINKDDNAPWSSEMYYTTSSPLIFKNDNVL